MIKQLQHALELQRNAWNNGHENYGASIDVEAEALEILYHASEKGYLSKSWLA
ncbi:rIII lysis inhibitor accessory [Escherichia phage vB_EcoP_EP32B]|nr:rIII lysis inhibitor accessory [Escherichia phage vB_EcoP_EP32B]